MFHFQFSKFIREDCALSPRHYQNTGVYSDMKKKRILTTICHVMTTQSKHRPMPYMTIGDETTTTGGNYLSDTATGVAYDGPYLRMADRCGTASLDTATGLDWGGSAGTDCDTPGFGGAGNTHSSRSGFYELNKIMEIARSHLPNNNWLQQKLISNMNINSSCNAFWNGVSVNFYKSSCELIMIEKSILLMYFIAHSNFPVTS
jgi:hypothetical protein